MAHTIYENFVLENKMEDLLTTAVDMNAYMTADTSLTENAGMKKKVNPRNVQAMKLACHFPPLARCRTNYYYMLQKSNRQRNKRLYEKDNIWISIYWEN